MSVYSVTLLRPETLKRLERQLLVLSLHQRTPVCKLRWVVSFDVCIVRYLFHVFNPNI